VTIKRKQENIIRRCTYTAKKWNAKSTFHPETMWELDVTDDVADRLVTNTGDVEISSDMSDLDLDLESHKSSTWHPLKVPLNPNY
jgi:hypothetical protein